MRLIGYCRRCRKIRYVLVAGQDAAMLAMRPGLAQGICSDCEREQRGRRL